MGKSKRKILLMAGKLLLAGGLLAWVVSKASWSDYVVDLQGRQLAVVERRGGPDGSSFIARPGPVWSAERQQVTPAELKPLEDAEGKPERNAAGGIKYVHWGFASTLRNLNGWLLAGAMAGFLASVGIVSVRWWFLLRIQSIHIRPWESLRLTFLGNFFSQVVPGTVGGDLVKAWYVSRHTHRKAAVLVSIFVDRVLGMTELAFLSAVSISVALSAGLRRFQDVRLPAIAVGVVILIVIGALAFLLSQRFRRLFHLQTIYRRLPIAHHIEAAGDAARLYRRRLPALVKAIAITFGAHVVWVGSISLLGRSLSLPTPWFSYFVYVPLIYIIGAVPATPGGVGLIEKLYLVFFAPVDPSMVLALALLARLVPLIWTLPGIVVAVTGPKLPKADVLKAELTVGESAKS